MNCLADLIGIRTACEVIEGSAGLNIEDIGITPDECNSYINKEYANGEALIKDKISFAGTIISKLINNHFAANIISKSLISSQTLGIFRDSLNLQSGVANNYGGINLRLNNSNSYLSIFVNSISIQVNVTQTVPVKIIDLISGMVLDTFNISAVANKISSVLVNKVYQNERQVLDLIIVYDTTGISSNNTLLANFGVGGNGCAGCQGYRYSNSYIWSAPIYIPTASQQIRSNLVGGSHTFGVSVNYSVQCSTDKWICDIANLIAMPLLYLAGELIMDYALLYSDRQNSDTNIDYERNKERKLGYNDMYNKAIQASIKSINLPKGDICFKCQDVIRSVVILP